MEDKDIQGILSEYADELRSIFIVSEASLQDGEKPAGVYESEEVKGLAVFVEPAEAEKCGRCWIHDPSVGVHADHPTACTRCKNALEVIGAFE